MVLIKCLGDNKIECFIIQRENILIDDVYYIYGQLVERKFIFDKLKRFSCDFQKGLLFILQVKIFQLVRFLFR